MPEASRSFDGDAATSAAADPPMSQAVSAGIDGLTAPLLAIAYFRALQVGS